MLNHSNTVAWFLFQAAASMSSTRCSASGPISNSLFWCLTVVPPPPIPAGTNRNFEKFPETHYWDASLLSSFVKFIFLCLQTVCVDAQAKKQTNEQTNELMKIHSCSLILSSEHDQSRERVIMNSDVQMLWACQPWQNKLSHTHTHTHTFGFVEWLRYSIDIDTHT